MDEFMKRVFEVTKSVDNVVISEEAWSGMKDLLTDKQLTTLNSKFGEPQALPIKLFVEE